MNAYANVSLIENKLDELLSENHLVHTFRTSSYPRCADHLPGCQPGGASDAL